MMDPAWDRYPLYLVWVKKDRPNGHIENVDLRAVDTNEALAELHRDMIIRDEPDAIAVWIEKRDTDHLYGQRDVARALRMSRSLERFWSRD